jgi:L-serine deaminase
MEKYNKKLQNVAADMLEKLDLTHEEKEIVLIAAIEAINAVHGSVRALLSERERIRPADCVVSALAIALKVMHTLQQEKAIDGL